MATNGQEQSRRPKAVREEEREGERTAAGVSTELPLESSPYVKYTDLEDYKMHGYGTQGHLAPVDNHRNGGATDAPTISGAGLSETQAKVVDSVNRHTGGLA